MMLFGFRFGKLPIYDNVGTIVKAMSASVASGITGAITSSKSPTANETALGNEYEPVELLTINVRVPCATPFLRILNTAVVAALVPHTAVLPVNPTGSTNARGVLKRNRTQNVVGAPL